MINTELLVVGGGPSGIAAAISAAREGIKVILIEKYGFLGGMGTLACVGTICGLYLRKNNGEIEYVNGGFAQEFTDKLKESGGAIGPVPWKETAVLGYTPWKFKQLADELIENEENIKLLLHTIAVDAIVEEGLIKEIEIYSKSGKERIRAEVMVDSTGDGEVAFLAGLSFEKEEKRLSFPSMIFFMNNVNVQKVMEVGLDKLTSLLQDEEKTKGYALTRSGGNIIPTFRGGEVIVSMNHIMKDGRSIDATIPEEITYGELKGRKEVVECARFLIEQMPGFEEAYLVDTATQLGVRETRRIKGLYTLEEDDVMGGKKFDDAILSSAWPIEMHDSGKETEFSFLEKGKYYQIPYRCLIPRGAENLIVTGRCISASHRALASTRVMGVCIAEGQAGGLAASLGVKNKISLKEINISDLQSLLRLRGVKI